MKFAWPVTVNWAAVTVPVVVGRVTPPVVVLVPSVARITVPGVALTATLPKFISVLLAIAMGVIIVAEAFEVALTCAKVAAENEKIITAITENLFRVFIN